MLPRNTRIAMCVGVARTRTRLCQLIVLLVFRKIPFVASRFPAFSFRARVCTNWVLVITLNCVAMVGPCGVERGCWLRGQGHGYPSVRVQALVLRYCIAPELC